ncbi:MAG: hypothetical protein ACRDRH_11025 [Pseudonocardia sp.]
MAFWNEQALILYASVVIIVLVTIHESIRALTGVAQLRKLRAYERDARAVLSAALALTVKNVGAPWDRVGAHAFLIRGFWRFRRLSKVGGVRLGAEPSMSDPRWKPGKGVVGIAYEKRDIVTIDWRALFQAAAAAGPDAWRAAAVDSRFGLTWGELMRTQNYTGLAGCPVFDSGGKLIGAVTIDAPLSMADLNSDPMKQILRDLARAVDDLGRPPSSWWRYNGPGS